MIINLHEIICEIFAGRFLAFFITREKGNNSPANGEKCITYFWGKPKGVRSSGQAAVNPTVQIKEVCFIPAQFQQFFGNRPDIFLPGDFMIGQVDA